MFYLVVVAGTEEYLDGIRPAQQVVNLRVVVYLATDVTQHLGIGQVLRVFDDDLLLRDVALHAKSKHPHQDVLVQVDVEDHRVVVGLVGEEHGDGRQHDGAQQLAEPYRPVVVAGHLHARAVQDVEDDEHENGDDDGDAEAALADDGTQRSADEEEDEARQRQRYFVDSLHLVHALLAVQPP